MKNKDKFLALVSTDVPTTLDKVKERLHNRAMLRESQKIALKILKRLEEIGWSQKDLAEAMGVSPQQISKIVKGKENLTLETQIKLQETLDIPILASYHERDLFPKVMHENVLTVRVERIFEVEESDCWITENYTPAMSLSKRDIPLHEYSYQKAV
jgi:transcriptional regulator with XRE-family HTH domain